MLTLNSAQYALIRLQGEYDIARQEELRCQLAPAHVAPIALLDMRDVTFMDASALTQLIRLKRQMPDPAVVRMVGVLPDIRRLLDITGLAKTFEIHDTLAGARA